LVLFKKSLINDFNVTHARKVISYVKENMIRLHYKYFLLNVV